ncbi:hypothetical protein DFH08DRAFT_902246, partial [Mycena albidolilacea]
MQSPWLIWGVALGLVCKSLLFSQIRTFGCKRCFPLLGVQSIALLMFVEGPFTFMGLALSWAVFLGSLSLSIAAYRLSPSGIAFWRSQTRPSVTKLRGFWKTSQGYKYIYHKKLHDTD